MSHDLDVGVRSNDVAFVLVPVVSVCIATLHFSSFLNIKVWFSYWKIQGQLVFMWMGEGLQHLHTRDIWSHENYFNAKFQSIAQSAIE